MCFWRPSTWAARASVSRVTLLWEGSSNRSSWLRFAACAGLDTDILIDIADIARKNVRAIDFWRRAEARSTMDWVLSLTFRFLTCLFHLSYCGLQIWTSFFPGHHSIDVNSTMLRLLPQ